MDVCLKVIQSAIDHPEEHLTLTIAHEAAGVVAWARARYFRAPDPLPPRCVPEGWYLLGLNVFEAWQRRGLAEALTRARLNILGERTELVRYFTREANTASRALHDRHGFVLEREDVWFPSFQEHEGTFLLFRREHSSDGHTTGEPFRVSAGTPGTHPQTERADSQVLARVRDLVPGAAVDKAGGHPPGDEGVDIVVHTSAEAFAATRLRLDATFWRDPRQPSNDHVQGYRLDTAGGVAIQCRVSDAPHDRSL